MVSDIPVPDGVSLYYIPVPILVTLPLVRQGQRSSLLLRRTPQYGYGEPTHLKLTDLNLEQRWVRVMGKGSKVGICPFPAKTAKAIWHYLLDFRNGFWESSIDNYRAHYACLTITRFKD